MVMEGELSLGVQHTMQHIDDALQNCTSGTYISLPANVTAINLILKKDKNFPISNGI